MLSKEGSAICSVGTDGLVALPFIEPGSELTRTSAAMTFVPLVLTAASGSNLYTKYRKN